MDYEKILNEKLHNNEYKLEEAQAIFDYAMNLKSKNLPVIFDRFHLALYLNISDGFLKQVTFQNNIDSMYNTFYIPKRNGQLREINAPKEKLKEIQNWIYDNILSKLRISCAAKAYVKNKSIVDNAKLHIKRKNILKLDFKDFFPNISYTKIYLVFLSIGYTKGVSYLLAKLCSYKNHLAQGAPTSPCISNICSVNLDLRLLKYGQYNDIHYTRYADDITLSTSYNFSKNDFRTISKIIKEEGFTLNKEKTKLLNKNQRHLITGIVVNEKLNVLKKIKNKLRQEIYFCKKYGVNNHLLYQGKVYSFYKEHLYGMAYYIFMINQDIGKYFLDELKSVQWDY